MKLNEMFTDNLPKVGHYDEKEDTSPLKLSDLRKTKLTLSQIHRLRIMNDVRQLEHEQDLEKVKKQYKPPAAEAPMM